MDHDVAVLDGSLVSDAVDSQAGFGALETARGRLPLTALAVEARIVGLIAETRMRQTFRNSLDEPLEATYIFPLPDRAAVTRFRLHVAGRTVDGELKERGQARGEYDAAIAKGHRAAIAEEDRSGVFQLRVGNLPPREEAIVELTMVGPVPVADGEATFRFPLVVAPRYTPGIPLDGPSVGSGTTPDTDQVPDASRVTPPVLLPGFPNPVALSLTVELDPASVAAGDPDWARRIRSSLHSVVTAEGPPWTVSLRPGERLNRDFLLRYPVAQESLATSLYCHAAAGERPGTFALTLFPPAGQNVEKPAPRRIVFLLDRSGSMSGWKMVAARRALGRMIDTLLDQDQFTVVAFDTVIERPPHASRGLVAGSDRERWKMLEWLGTVDARGGTEMGLALQDALGLIPQDTDSQRSILVLITDGEVTGEDAILRTLGRRGQPSLPRIFTIGIDRAVNAGFLRKLADYGQGDCELVESEDRLDQAMDRIHRSIGTPLLTQVRVETLDGELVADSLAPGRVPDLYVDRPLTLFGRHRSNHEALRLRVQALDAAGRPWQQEVTGQAAPENLLVGMWGRAKVRDLEDEYAAGQARDTKALMARIVQVSLESRVLSRFTAYVAADNSDVVNPGGRPQEIVQPVEFPDGWDSRAKGLGALPPSARRSSLALCDVVCDAISPTLAASPDLDDETYACFDMLIDDTTPLAPGGGYPARARQMLSRLSSPSGESPASPPCDPAQSADETRGAVVPDLDRLLEEAIRLGASEISIALDRKRIRIQFLISGKWTVHASSLPASWDEWLKAIKRRMGIDPASQSWPQHGELRWQNFALSVVITRARKQETVSIQIPLGAAGTGGSPDAGPTAAEKRTRFWTC
jgi:Ca-activated chloride channel family protein